MKTNLLIESFKTFTNNHIGLIIDGNPIPKGSTGKITYTGDPLTMQWTVEGKNIDTIIPLDEFWNMLQHEFIVDISEVCDPKTLAKYQKGDLIKIYGDYEGIISSSKYNYELNTWEYQVYTIWDDLEKDIIDIIYTEDDLDIVDTYETELAVGKFHYKLKLERLLN